MEMIRTECRSELDMLSPEFCLLEKGLEGDIPLEDVVSIERYSGSIKIKNPNNSLINLIRQDRFLMKVAALFCCKFGLPMAIYHLSHDGSLKHPAVPGSATEMIAYQPHFDTSIHGLKVLSALEQIYDENAPFLCLERSRSDVSIIIKRIKNFMLDERWYHSKIPAHWF
jgi:hypothetical protein